MVLMMLMVDRKAVGGGGRAPLQGTRFLHPDSRLTTSSPTSVFGLFRVGLFLILEGISKIF